MEKEARADALRAWNFSPRNPRAILVSCVASLHYADQLAGEGKQIMRDS